MKKSKFFILGLILFAATTLFAGCAFNVEDFENADVRQRTEAMLDAVIADDFDAAYALTDGICTEEEFTPIFEPMQKFLSGINSYNLKLLSINNNKTTLNGQTNVSINSIYEMTTERGKIIVQIQTLGDNNTLGAFYVAPYEGTNYYYTGVLTNMKNASAAQWILLLLNIPVIGFTVFAIVDCCRNKIKKKGLWLLLLILGFVTVGMTISASGFRVNLNIAWLTMYSALLRYGSGALAFRLMLPVAAVCYFAKRRSLLIVPAQEQVESELPQDDMAETQDAQEPVDEQP